MRILQARWNGRDYGTEFMAHKKTSKQQLSLTTIALQREAQWEDLRTWELITKEFEFELAYFWMDLGSQTLVKNTFEFRLHNHNDNNEIRSQLCDSNLSQVNA